MHGPSLERSDTAAKRPERIIHDWTPNSCARLNAPGARKIPRPIPAAQASTAPGQWGISSAPAAASGHSDRCKERKAPGRKRVRPSPVEKSTSVASSTARHLPLSTPGPSCRPCRSWCMRRRRCSRRARYWACGWRSQALTFVSSRAVLTRAPAPAPAGQAPNTLRALRACASANANRGCRVRHQRPHETDVNAVPALTLDKWTI